MTIPSIDESDLDSLSEVFPALDFSDEERRAVLLEAGRRDIQAVPGSGKTTLLAVKLLLLAGRWPHANRGICVLSHTNVARDEIARRLRKTSAGSRLLAYPHFVGTIHAFVNTFLALPLLRSDGYRVDIVDNDVFAARAIAALSRKHTLRTWVERNPYQGPLAVGTLRYEGPGLKLGWERGGIPGAGTESFTQAKALKDGLAKQGIFRHDDMFAFAERLFARVPELGKRLSWRFPLVLVDEMQDTSWDQERILDKAFEGSVIMQRYGDRNQRILNSDANAQQLTFPRANYLHVSTTKRFGEKIAAAVRAVQETGKAISGAANDEGPCPVLLLYDTKSVTEVIRQFGSLVLAKIPEELMTGPVKAVCARKQGGAKQPPGRHVGDYWPPYERAMASSGQENVRTLLTAPPEMGVASMSLDARVRDVRRAVLLCLRFAKSDAVRGIRDGSGLLRALEAAGKDVESVRRLCRDLTLRRDLVCGEDAWRHTLDEIFDGLLPLLPAGTTREAFVELEAFKQLTDAAALGTANECVVEENGRSVCVQIGTIASVKGETHVATLVLESHGGKSKKFDVATALPNIADATEIDSKASELLRVQYRNLYVAMSRPRHLLCAAMNKERAKDSTVEAIRERGWEVVEVT